MRVIGTILALLLIASCGSATQVESQKKKRIGMPNPASVKCHDDGYKLEIRTGKGGGQIGICIDAKGSECEEWAYFRGECKLQK